MQLFFVFFSWEKAKLYNPLENLSSHMLVRVQQLNFLKSPSGLDMLPPRAAGAEQDTSSNYCYTGFCRPLGSGPQELTAGRLSILCFQCSLCWYSCSVEETVIWLSCREDKTGLWSGKAAKEEDWDKELGRRLGWETQTGRLRLGANLSKHLPLFRISP